MDTIEGRMRPVVDSDRELATRRLLLAAMALVALLATLHAVYLGSYWLGEQLITKIGA